jgi:L-aminopeptidase/D-esterase-like protein
VSPGFFSGFSATGGAVQEGAVGARTTATVGKLSGMSQAAKSGIGSATGALEGGYAGAQVAALAAVNAFGDIVDPETGRIVASARLTRMEAYKLAEQAQFGIARAVRFAPSLGGIPGLAG